MAKDLGWIKLYRSSFNNKFYFAEPFTRWQAWVDLLLLTNHKDGILRVRGNRIDIKRGQVGWSEDELSKRWKWSRGKVRRFFDELEKTEQQIVQQKNNIKSLLSIVNFDKYQSDDTTNGTTDSTTDGRQTVQQTVQQTDTNKNVKNDNNEKNINGQNGILKNSNLFRQPNIPKFEEVHRVFLNNGGTEEMAKTFFNSNEGLSWFRNGSPITNFSNLVPSYVETWKKNIKNKNGVTAPETGNSIPHHMKKLN